MHASAHSDESTNIKAGETAGIVMNLGWRYDAMVWLVDRLIFRGRLKGLQRIVLELAELEAGDAVLDVGCGTGTLALEAKRRVGDAGRVAGVDPGPKQIRRARSRAARRGLELDFRVGVIERLPFADDSFDAVTSTLMMHHLPDDVKRAGLAEIGRALRSGGRVVIADFKRPERARDVESIGAGAIGAQDHPALLEAAGFYRIRSGTLRMPRFPGVHGAAYAVGVAP